MIAGERREAMEKFRYVERAHEREGERLEEKEKTQER